MICQYASAPRHCGTGADPFPGTSFAISLTLPSPCIPGLALSHGQTAPGARLCPGTPHPARGQPGSGASCGTREQPRQSMREIPSSPGGTDKPEGKKKYLTSTERRLGGENLPRSASLTRLEDGVKNRNNNYLKKKKTIGKRCFP